LRGGWIELGFEGAFSGLFVCAPRGRWPLALRFRVARGPQGCKVLGQSAKAEAHAATRPQQGSQVNARQQSRLPFNAPPPVATARVRLWLSVWRRGRRGRGVERGPVATACARACGDESATKRAGKGGRIAFSIAFPFRQPCTAPLLACPALRPAPSPPFRRGSRPRLPSASSSACRAWQGLLGLEEKETQHNTTQRRKQDAMSAQKGSGAAVVPPVPVIEDALFLKSTDPSPPEGWFVSSSSSQTTTKANEG